MDINWIVDENRRLAMDGQLCPRQAIAGMLNALAMSETDTICQYTNIKNAVMQICKDDEKFCSIICKMLDDIISDEGDHQASAQKAANLCQGIKAPKPEEYNKADKKNDTEAV